MSTSFSSEGFDLDAAAAAADANGDCSSSGEVVYELGGGVSTSGGTKTTDTTHVRDREVPDPLAKSEASKAEGNLAFKAGNYLDAHDFYTDAVDACPGEPTGVQLLKLREEFEDAQREAAADRHQKEMDRRRAKDMKEAEKRRQRSQSHIGEKDGNNDDNEEEVESEPESESEQEPAAKFDPPTHPHSSALAIYHANRAACSLHLNRPADCIEDCTIAIMLNPKYVKAYLRRSNAHEQLEDTEAALKDAKVALEIDPRNAAARKNVARLQKIEDERMEKLKEETLGKLKDLGNSILGNFGLSLDNFNAVKDENTGSYSISFNQGGGAGSS